MEQRPKSGMQKDVRLMNLKEDIALQQKLNLLNIQYRYTLKMLQQRRNSIILENRKLLLLRFCEPKATVNKNMIEIAKTKKAGMDFRDIHTSGGRRSYSSKSLYYDRGSDPLGLRRSASARPMSAKPTDSARYSVTDEGRLSIMKMKNIATIDCISKKELTSRQQNARGEMERLKAFRWEALHQRVKSFIEKLNDTDDTELLSQPHRDI